MATAEKETIDRKAKLALNKITNENYAKIKPQILDIYQSAETEEEQKMFIKVFFLKACHEEKYTELYIDLIRFIAREVSKSQNNGRIPEKFSLLRQDFVDKIRIECQFVFK